MAAPKVPMTHLQIGAYKAEGWGLARIRRTVKGATIDARLLEIAATAECPIMVALGHVVALGQEESNTAHWNEEKGSL